MGVLEHEAAHAACAISVGVVPRYLEVDEASGVGEVAMPASFDPRDEAERRDFAIKKALMTMASEHLDHLSAQDKRHLATFREYLGEDGWREVEKRWQEVRASERFKTLFRAIVIPLYGGSRYLSSADLQCIAERYDRKAPSTASVDQKLAEIRTMMVAA